MTLSSSGPQLKGLHFLFHMLSFYPVLHGKEKKAHGTGLTKLLFWFFETRSSLFTAQDGLELLLPQPPGSYDLQAYLIGMAYSQNLNINNYLNITVLEFTYNCTFKICKLYDQPYFLPFSQRDNQEFMEQFIYIDFSVLY